MFEKAIALEPNNIFYKQIYLQHLPNSAPLTGEPYIEFAKKIVAHDPEIEKVFAEKGALGESVRSSLEYSSRKILGLPYASF